MFVNFHSCNLLIHILRLCPEVVTLTYRRQYETLIHDPEKAGIKPLVFQLADDCSLCVFQCLCRVESSIMVMETDTQSPLYLVHLQTDSLPLNVCISCSLSLPVLLCFYFRSGSFLLLFCRLQTFCVELLM